MAWPAAAVAPFGVPAAAPAFGTPASYGTPAGPADYDVPNPPGDCISSLAFSPKGAAATFLSATSWDKTVRVWGIQTAPAADGSVSAVQATPLGQQAGQLPLLTACMSKDGRCFYGGCDKTVTMWAVQTGQVAPVAYHDQPISHCEFVEDGVSAPMLITAAWDGKVRFWDLRQQTPAKEEDFQAPVLHFDASTAPMATFLTSRKVHVYQLTTLTRFRDLEPVEAARFQFRRVSNFKDQSAVAAGTVDGRVVLWPLAAGQAGTQLKCHGGVLPGPTKDQYDAFPVNFVAVHPTGKKVVTGASDGSVKLFDMGTKLPTIIQKEMPQTMAAGAMNAEGTLVAYANSYDWSLGKEAYNPAVPNTLKIHAVTAADLAPKK